MSCLSPVKAVAVLVILAYLAVAEKQGQCEKPGECGEGKEPLAKDKIKEDAFFNTYSNPVGQSKMILDKPRSQAYGDAMLKNKELFKDAIVIDVGCGSGILSLFAAKAGAEKVFCVEYTDISHTTREIVTANGFDGTIEVIQAKIEDIDLPIDHADIIVSEWMGYFGLFEGMYTSVLHTRDKYLRDGGHVLPNKITLFAAAASEAPVDLSRKEIKRFKKTVYGFDFSPMQSLLKEWYKFEAESKSAEWRSGTYPEIAQVPKKEIASSVMKVAEIDMQTATDDDFDLLHKTVTVNVRGGRTVDRIVGWFTCDFTRGNHHIVLDTGPDAPETHWHQMVFHLKEAIAPVEQKSKLYMEMVIRTRGDYHREMNVHLSVGLVGEKKKITKSYTVVILPDTTHWVNG